MTADSPFKGVGAKGRGTNEQERRKKKAARRSAFVLCRFTSPIFVYFSCTVFLFFSLLFVSCFFLILFFFGFYVSSPLRSLFFLGWFVAVRSLSSLRSPVFGPFDLSWPPFFCHFCSSVLPRTTKPPPTDTHAVGALFGGECLRVSVSMRARLAPWTCCCFWFLPHV